jgi:hypothetical protein
MGMVLFLPKCPYEHQKWPAAQGVLLADLSDLMSMSAEIEHRQNDQNGNELGQNAHPHQTIRPIARGLPADPKRVKPAQQNQRDGRKPKGHKKFTQH